MQTSLLSQAQRGAIDVVDTCAKADEAHKQRLEQSPRYREEWARCAAAMSHRLKHASIDVHFHPDRIDANGRTVLDGLNATGHYLSQFQTGTSNGSLSAHEGGIRFRWERDRFGGLYDGEPVESRPKYGALNLFNYSDGSAPRFGACYFVLHSAVLSRSTFSYGDSVDEPEHVGTTGAFDAITSQWLHDCLAGIEGPGPQGSCVSQQRHLIEKSNSCGWQGRLKQLPSRKLDHYVEAQVHGPVDLDRDVIGLVADGGYLGTQVATDLEALCARHDIEMAYSHGFRIDVHQVTDEFRGPRVPKLAKHIANQGQVTVVELGMAARQLYDQPSSFESIGDPQQVWQTLKQLWHTMVAFGSPILPATDSGQPIEEW